MADETRITWHINIMSYYDERRAEDLEKRIIDACHLDESDRDFLKNDFCILLMCTERMDFDPVGARRMLVELQTFLTQWQDMTPEQLWDYRIKRVNRELMEAWRRAFKSAQTLFEPDPAQLPKKALTPEQRQEAETPGTPLTLPEPLSPSA